MTWKKYLILLGIVLLLIIVFRLYESSLPCDGGLFIGLCGLTRLIFSVIAIVLTINYAIVSLLIYKPWKEESHPKNIIQIVALFLVAAVTSVILLIPEYQTTNTILRVIQQKMLNVYVSKVRNNYSVKNFAEKPVVNSQTGKFDGIEVSFDLAVGIDDDYFGVVNIEPYFGNYMIDRFDEYIAANKPKKYTFILKPTDSFYNLKPDGPYPITILIGPKNEEKLSKNDLVKSQQYDYSIRFTANKKDIDDPADLYRSDLITKPYIFSDFYSPKYAFDPTEDLKTYSHPGCGPNSSQFPFSIQVPTNLTEKDFSQEYGYSFYSYSKDNFEFYVTCSLGHYENCADNELIQQKFIEGRNIPGCLVRDRQNNEIIFNLNFVYYGSNIHGVFLWAKASDKPENVLLINQILSSLKIIKP